MLFNGCVFPGYRWCGPGCSGPGPPTNPVDACCMNHDLCLQSGNDPCYCDQLFLESLEAYLHGREPENRHARIMHLAIRFRMNFRC
jgi:hypothetical protein